MVVTSVGWESKMKLSVRNRVVGEPRTGISGSAHPWVCGVLSGRVEHLADTFSP